jgi:uncharacterized OB-fold protein
MLTVVGGSMTYGTAFGRCANLISIQAMADEYKALLRDHGVPVVQRCDECQRPCFPPLLGCPQCGSSQLVWIAAGTTGKVGTFVTVHRRDPTASMTIPRRLLDQIPYTSVYVMPDEVPEVRIAALMTGPQQSELAVGSTVRLRVGRNSPVVIANLAK